MYDSEKEAKAQRFFKALQEYVEARIRDEGSPHIQDSIRLGEAMDELEEAIRGIFN